MTSEQAALEMRRLILRMHRIGPHVGASLSCADIIAVLYFSVMDVGPTRGRDRFILSKGHAASALYAALALKGLLAREVLESYMKDSSPLCGHPVSGLVPGVEVSTGSLGHGLAIGVGIALAGALSGAKYRTFVLMGDGECQEGEVWEAGLLGARLGLERLVAIVDRNGLQGYARTSEIMREDAITKMFQAAGWDVREADGHDHEVLRKVLSEVPAQRGVPRAIIAKTVKGKGIKVMEDRLEWHYFSVPEERLSEFLAELDQGQ